MTTSDESQSDMPDGMGQSSTTDSKPAADLDVPAERTLSVGLQRTENETTEIRVIRAAASELTYAELEVEYSFSADGEYFTCNALRYRAGSNGRKSGNLYLRFYTGFGAFPKTELTNDDGHQDGQWRPISGGRSIVCTATDAKVELEFIYDVGGAPDRTLNGSIDAPFVPAAPGINSPGVVPASFDATGTGIVNADVTVYRSNDVLLGSGKVLNDKTWKVRVSFPASESSLVYYARQKIGNKESANSTSVTATLQIAPVTIETPRAGAVITVPTPTLTGKGHNGARIDIWRQGGDGGIFGTGTVQGTSWSVKLTKPLTSGDFTFHAEQVTLSGDRKWSNEVPVNVQLKPGTLLISNPPANTIVNRTFDVSGTGGAAGADIKVMLDLQDRVVGTTRAQGDSWSASVTLPGDIPPGEVRLACEQILNGIPSDRSPYRPFKLRPERVTSLAATVDDDAKVTITGTGTVGATLYIHYVGDGAPLKTFTVPSNPWSMDYPDWFPGVAPYRIGARQSVAGSDGQPIYSDWADREGTFTVNVPMPTLNHRVSPDGIPTFSGRGRNWPDQPASTIEVRLNNTNDPIVPIVDVQPDRSWTSAAAERWAPGTHSVTARQSFQTLSSTWLQPPETVIIPAPLAVIEKVTPNGLLAKVNGQCWPGAVVTITFSDSPTSHPVTETDKNGEWDFQRPTAFRPGRHTVTVTQTFGGQTSNPVSLSFDIVLSAPVITPPDNGQTDHLSVLYGTGGIEDCTISVYDFVTQALLGEAIATGDGWSVQLTELDYQTYTVFAVQELGDLKSQHSAPVAFTVVLFAPRIDVPKTGTSVPRTFTVEGYARAGNGFDRTEVDVYLDDAAHRVYPNFDDGYFKQHFTRPLGPCVLKARQYFKDQESPFTQDVCVTIVPDKSLTETPDSNEVVEQTAMICGFGYPGDTVAVALAGATGSILGTGVVQVDRTWFCLIKLPETQGDVSIVTEQRNGDFVSGWSDPRHVSLSGAAPTFTEPSEGAWGTPTPRFGGEAQVGAVVDVMRWYSVDEKLIQGIDTPGGRWAGESEQSLSEGPQWARAVQVVGGKRSMATDSKRFEIAPSDEPPRRHPKPE